MVYVPLRSKTIKVFGEVKRPSIFELQKNENFKDLKSFFGGFLPTTYLKRASLERINSFESRKQTGLDRIVIDLDFSDLSIGNDSQELFDGDEITFFKIFDGAQNALRIQGPVKRPGIYSYEQNIKISDLILKSDGLISDDVYRERIDLIRTLPNENKSLITFNLDSVMFGNIKHDILLEPNDVLTLYRLSDKIFEQNVTIEGFVKKPGVKNFMTGMTVADLVFMGGGFDDDSHLGSTYTKRADLIRYDKRNNKNTLITFRLDSVLAGHGSASNLLKMGDKIRIYSIDEIEGEFDLLVSINGFVKSPGTYDYTSNMDIRDLLFMASGYKDQFFKGDILMGRADLIRVFDSPDDPILMKLDLGLILNNDKPFPLKPGDKLTIFSAGIFKENKKVTVSGLVKNPGEYQLVREMNVFDLILAAGGFSIPGSMYKVEISSLIGSKDFQLSDTRTIYMENIEASYEDKNFKTDYILKNNDFISVTSEDLSRHHVVSIEGEIKFPGQYVLNNKTTKLSEIIIRAGGLTDYANDVASFLVREGEEIALRYDKVKKTKRSKYNIELIDGDLIRFTRKMNVVRITGQVKNPGVYQYVNNVSSKDYIQLAGGFTRDAARYYSSIKYPNGFSSKIGIFSDPKVYDGSEINIPQKEEVEKFSFTEYAQSFVAIYTDLLQAVALLSILNSNASN